MHCPRCGKEIADQAFAFCPHCGGALAGGFDVFLVDVGRKRIRVIKELRELGGLGLKEANGLSEQTPSLLASDISRDQADTIRARLEPLGATVEVRSAGGRGELAEAPLDRLSARLDLDERELAAARRLIAARPPSEAEELLDLLSGLHRLYRSGVLTEAEFNEKKWELLSRG